MLTAGRTRGETRKLWGDIRVGNGPGFHRPSGNKHPYFLKRLDLSSNRHWKCRPVVSLARAGPSRPGRCWSTTQRSYLMTIVPPLEALYSLPLPEEPGSSMTVSSYWTDVTLPLPRLPRLTCLSFLEWPAQMSWERTRRTKPTTTSKTNMMASP